jgi:hypothetical protein
MEYYPSLVSIELQALSALAVVAAAAVVADDEHGAALAATGLVGRHVDEVDDESDERFGEEVWCGDAGS